jgi:alpha-N-arabinofuranosidase
MKSVTCAGFASSIALATCLGGALAKTNSSSVPLHLTVETEGGNKSSPILYGVMFEVSKKLAICVSSFVANIRYC